MDIQQINGRGDGDSIRVSFKNVDGGGTISVGQAIALVTGVASFDGAGAVKATGATWKTFAGVSQSNVPVNGFGKATIWGMASFLISNVGTSLTVTAGDVLVPGAVAGTWFSGVTDQALSTMGYRYVVAGSTTTISGSAYVSGFIRGF